MIKYLTPKLSPTIKEKFSAKLRDVFGTNFFMTTGLLGTPKQKFSGKNINTPLLHMKLSIFWKLNFFPIPKLDGVTSEKH